MNALDAGVGAAVVAGVALSNLVARLRTRDWRNPVALITLGFFIPLAVSLLRLSDLQAARWADETYVVVLEALVCWLLLPAALLLYPRKASPGSLQGMHLDWRFQAWARGFALAHVGAVLLQNYLLGGRLVLLVDPDLAYELHADTVPGIQVLGRAGFVAAALLHLNFVTRRRRLDVALLGLICLAPITKLARIDLLMIGVTLALMNAYFPVMRVTRRRVAALVLAGFLAIYGLVELGNQRVNRFGRYSFSYADAIGFKASPGPGESFAVLYGYFPLSFENFDRFVRRNPDYRTNGLLSFSPVFNSFFMVSKLTARRYPTEHVVVERRNPVGPMATVGTALSTFYLDFGAAGAWLPMVAYMLLWSWMYVRSRRSAVAAFLYCTFSSAMVLSSFQAVMSGAVIYQAIFLGAIPFMLFVQRRPALLPLPA